ncbi:MAG: hypothetical protein IPI97_15240 [Nitrosomonas sp.]|nr:hypothetical protein [Nitrosomonas sp.]
MAVNQSLKDQAKSIGVKPRQLSSEQRGWTDAQITTGIKPRGYILKVGCKNLTLKDIAKEHKISINVLRSRLKEYYRAEDAIRASLKHRDYQKYVSHSN